MFISICVCACPPLFDECLFNWSIEWWRVCLFVLFLLKLWSILQAKHAYHSPTFICFLQHAQKDGPIEKRTIGTRRYISKYFRSVVRGGFVKLPLPPLWGHVMDYPLVPVTLFHFFSPFVFSFFVLFFLVLFFSFLFFLEWNFRTVQQK